MLHLNFNNFSLDKIFIEVRFKDSFKLPLAETKYKILDKLSKKYSAINTDNPEQLSFLKPESNQQLHIQLNRIVFDWDKYNNLDEFVKSSYADLTYILKILEVNDIIRVGFRTFHHFDNVGTQSAINEFVFKEYLSPKLKSANFADEYFNPKVQISGKKGLNFFNLSISYAQEQIIESNFNQIMNQQIRDLLLVDLDGYRENLKVAKLLGFLNEIKELNSKLPDYLKSVSMQPAGKEG